MEERKFTPRQECRPTTSLPCSSDPRPPTIPFHTSQQPPYPARQLNSTSRPPCPLDRFLGPNGKLKPEEANRCHENNLCLTCGKANHKITTCPLATRVRAAILQENEALGPPMETNPTEVKQENELATLHIQHQ